MTLIYRGQKYEKQKTVQPNGMYMMSYRNVTYVRDNFLYALLKGL